MTNAAEKLNRAGRSHAGSISVPLDLSVFGESRMTLTDRTVYSAIRGFSLGDRMSEFTYKQLEDRYRKSAASISRSIRKIRQNPLFCRGKKVCEYKFCGEQPKKKDRYIVVPDWLHYSAFQNKRTKETVLLSDAQKLVLCYIRGFSPNGLHTTSNGIARALGISKSTASNALHVLRDCNLIETETKSGRTCSVNGSEKTTFRVKPKTLSAARDAVVRHEKTKKQEIKDADARSERDRYYAARKQMEAARIERLKEQLRADEIYREADDVLRRTEVDAGKASARRDTKALREIMQKRIQAKRAWRDSVARLGFSETDLEPHYRCEACHDTGERLADHTLCDCWRGRS